MFELCYLSNFLIPQRTSFSRAIRYSISLSHTINAVRYVYTKITEMSTDFLLTCMDIASPDLLTYFLLIVLDFTCKKLHFNYVSSWINFLKMSILHLEYSSSVDGLLCNYTYLFVCSKKRWALTCRLVKLNLYITMY